MFRLLQVISKMLQARIHYYKLLLQFSLIFTAYRTKLKVHLLPLETKHPRFVISSRPLVGDRCRLTLNRSSEEFFKSTCWPDLQWSPGALLQELFCGVRWNGHSVCSTTHYSEESIFHWRGYVCQSLMFTHTAKPQQASRGHGPWSGQNRGTSNDYLREYRGGKMKEQMEELDV